MIIIERATPLSNFAYTFDLMKIKIDRSDVQKNTPGKMYQKLFWFCLFKEEEEKITK